MPLNDINESSKSNLENGNEIDNANQYSIIDSNKNCDESIEYNFGWNRYSEITNGRFAMIGFFSILVIEILSQKSFFSWAGIFN